MQRWPRAMVLARRSATTWSIQAACIDWQQTKSEQVLQHANLVTCLPRRNRSRACRPQASKRSHCAVTAAMSPGRSCSPAPAQVGQALLSAGVARQERVALLEKNSIAYFEVTVGAAQANAVVVAVNWRLAPAEIAYTVNNSSARVLIVGADFFAAVEQIEVAAHVRDQDRRHRRPSTLAGLRGLAGRTAAGGSPRARRAQRHLPAALYQWHDGSAQGRHDHQRQPHDAARRA